MTPKQALRDLAKARDLERRARVNYEKWARSSGISSRDALARADKQGEEADRLLDAVAAYLASL